MARACGRWTGSPKQLHQCHLRDTYFVGWNITICFTVQLFQVHRLCACAICTTQACGLPQDHLKPMSVALRLAMHGARRTVIQPHGPEREASVEGHLSGCANKSAENTPSEHTLVDNAPGLEGDLEGFWPCGASPLTKGFPPALQLPEQGISRWALFGRHASDHAAAANYLLTSGLVGTTHHRAEQDLHGLQVIHQLLQLCATQRHQSKVFPCTFGPHGLSSCSCSTELLQGAQCRWQLILHTSHKRRVAHLLPHPQWQHQMCRLPRPRPVRWQCSRRKAVQQAGLEACRALPSWPLGIGKVSR